MNGRWKERERNEKVELFEERRFW